MYLVYDFTDRSTRFNVPGFTRPPAPSEAQSFGCCPLFGLAEAGASGNNKNGFGIGTVALAFGLPVLIGLLIVAGGR